MKAPFPSAWLLLGALVAPAAIAMIWGSGGVPLWILPIASGVLCGLCMLATSDSSVRFHRTTLAAASGLALLCSLTSLILVFGACAGSAGSGTGSTTINTTKMPNFGSMIAERMAGVPGESEWNRAGVWYRVEDTPPTYLPVGYSSGRPRTEAEGEWLVDERDGKRLFVPHGGTDRIRQPILRAEAAKVTNWEEEAFTR